MVIVRGGVAERHGGVHDVDKPVPCGKSPCVPVGMAMAKPSIQARNIYLLAASMQIELLGSKRPNQDSYDGGSKSLGGHSAAAPCAIAGSELYPLFAVEHFFARLIIFY